MRKVLILISELSYSGTPNSSLRLSRALLKAGYFVEVWSYKQGPFADEYKHHNVPIKIVSEKGFRNKKIINEILKFDFSICNSILTSEGFECISSLIPTYWYIREAENIPDFFMSNSRRGHLLKKCHNIITVSEYARDYVVKYFNTDVKVLHNCIDDYYAEYKDYKKDQHNKVKVIIIGAIERRKNQLCMLDAYEMLSGKIRDSLELHFVGRIPEWDVDYSRQFLERIKADGVIYHGEIRERREMMRLIAESDVLAVISTDESCSLTALEGAMMAKPLILSRNVGAKYLLDDANGWLVNTDDSQMLSQILTECIEKRERLSGMGIISRERYLETSTFDIYCKNVGDFFAKNRICISKNIYRLKNIGNYQSWFYDEFDKYYQYPDWGSREPEDKTYSFDIFDTLITRSVAEPVGIFSIMQSMLQNNFEFADIPAHVKSNFVVLRTGAENMARTVYCINGTEDKTLNQIYEMLGKTGELDEEQLKRIKQLEIDTEIENSIPIKKNIELVKQLVSGKKRVCLISDMYLSDSVIRQMLIKADPIFEGIKIYVSSECKKVKGSLGLFKYVQNKEKVSFKNWEHIGDNIHADYNAPLTLGISCEQYIGMEKSEYERKLLTFAQDDSYLQQILGLGNCLKANNIDEHIIYAYYLLKPYVDDLIEQA
ncbi:glycosyltransferase, partial [Pseudobutyrivibrio sp.]